MWGVAEARGHETTPEDELPGPSGMCDDGQPHDYQPLITRAGRGLGIEWRCRCGSTRYEASAQDKG